MKRAGRVGSEGHTANTLPSSGLPLELRLKNPPALFVGRAAERVALERLIDRAPLTIVSGLRGLGKTSLVLEVLHRRFPERAASAFMWSMRSGDSLASALAALCRAMATALRLEPPTVGELADPVGLVTTVIDLAERGGFWTLIDDVHVASEEEAAPHLRALAAYSRFARWIVTTRVAPDLPELREQNIVVGGLAPDDARELARLLAPRASDAELEQVLQVAGGSPWNVRQGIAGRPPSKATEEELLSGLPETSCAVVRALFSVEVPIQPEDIECMLGLARGQVSTELLDTLERRSLVECSFAGARLHDAARSWLGRAGAAKLESPARLRLAASPRHGARLEALRTMLELEAAEEAAALLAETHESLARSEHAARAWSLLEPNGGERLLPFKLALALELGGAPLSWAIRQPEPAALAPRLLWAKAQWLAGRFAQAAEVALGILAAGAAGALAAEATIVRARALVRLGRAEDVLTLLAAFRPETEDAAVIADTLRARALALGGRWAEAFERDCSVADGMLRASPAVRALVQEERVTLLMNLGRLAAAVAVDESSVVARSPRQWLSYSTRALESGRVGPAVDALDRAEPWAMATAAYRPIHRLNRLRVAFTLGDFAYAADAVDALMSDAATKAHIEMHAWCASAPAYLALVTGTTITIDRPQYVPGPASAFVDAILAIRDARHGRAGELQGAAEPSATDSTILFLLGRAYACLCCGDSDKAVEHASRAAALAEEHGWAIMRADSLVALGEALLVKGDVASTARALNELKALAQQLGSRRYALEAEWLELALDRAPRSLPRVEAIATCATVAPVAARRARAWLGESAILDLADRAVLAAWRASADVACRTLGADTDRGPSVWGIDSARQCIWDADGTVELSDSPLHFQLLETLLRHGGAATKKDLAEQVWAVRKYHPERDDKRIQVAVRRLRTRIEKNPSSPERLLTTPAGYQLALPVRHLARPRD